MNRHFSDARYYARRTAEELAAGVREELAPMTETAREATGRRREADVEPTRGQRVRAGVRDARPRS
ncbi:MAG: hypothetical protein ABEJ88_05980 [Halobacterium sp.]